MHKLFMATGILSMLTLAAAGGGLGYWSWTNPDDAGFVRDYLTHLSGEERETMRSFVSLNANKDDLTDKALREFLFDEELKSRLASVQDSTALEHVLLENIAAQRADREHQREQAQQMIDRLAARTESYDAERKALDARETALDERDDKRKDAETGWNERQKSSRLNQLVKDLDKTDEPEGLVSQLKFLPTSDLYYVLTNTRNAENRAVIIEQLPEPVQRAISEYGSNPAGIGG